MKTFLNRHLEVARDSVKRILGTPIFSFFTVLILGVAISMPLMLHKLTEAMNFVADNLESTNKVSLFLTLPEDIIKDDAKIQQTVNKLAGRLLEIPIIEDIVYVSREQALQEFGKSSGLSDLLDRLAMNPLPAMFVVEPVMDIDSDTIKNLVSRLSEFPGVDTVSYDIQWQERLDAIIALFWNASLVVGGLMGAGVVLITGNTVRTAVLNRSEEIQLLDQIGATTLFIMRPFLYIGAIQGLAGALMALILTGLCLHVLGEPVNRLAELYGSNFRIRAVAFEVGATVTAASCFLGWLVAGVTTVGCVRQLRSNVHGK